jgi:FKBP-type peptidyl-prolyl cis-trans isomerase (trigger factor)
MKVDVTTVNSFQKRLAFTVPPDQVRNRLDQAYKRIAGKVRLPGFRPGKAPRKVLEARFAQQIEAEVAQDLIQQSYRSALTDHAIQPVGSPSVDESSPVVEPDGFKFTIVVDVRPEIELQEWKGLEVEFPTVSVTPEEIERAIKARLEGQAKLEEVSDRPVDKGDLALVELTITDPSSIAAEASVSYATLVQDEGTAIDLSELNVESAGADKVRLSGPAERVRQAIEAIKALQPEANVEELPGAPEVAREPGTMIRTEGDPYYPGVDNFVIGMSLGETKEGEVSFGSTERAGAVAGRKLHVQAKLISVQSHKIPELTDELAGTLGYEGGADGMRTTIEAQIRHSRDELARNQARANLLEAVIAKNPFEVPQGMVEQSLRMLMDELRNQQAMRTGRDPKTIGFSEAQVRDLRMRSAFAAKAALILEWVAKREGIAVTDADVDSKFQQLATEWGQTVEAIKGRFRRTEDTAELRERILEEKTLDWMLEQSTLIAPKPPAAGSEAEASGVSSADLKVLEGSIDGLKQALSSGALDGQLDALMEAEQGSRARKGALSAIEGRKLELASNPKGPAGG